MARYGRDYDDVSRGMGRFYGQERHRFEGLFSDRDREDLDRGWERDRGSWSGGGRYDREYGAGGTGLGGGSLNRGYGRDYTGGGPGYTGGGSLGGSSFDVGYRGGRVNRGYGGDFDYGSDVSEMGGPLRHDYVGRDRDAGWNRARDDFGRGDYRTGGWNRGDEYRGDWNRGDWERGGDRDLGDRVREGWHDLREGFHDLRDRARGMFRGRGRYDRNW